MTEILPARESMKQAAEEARLRIADAPDNDSFASKIRLASAVKSKCEEFNIWHAGADNVTESGVDAAWGSMAKRIG